MLTIKNLRKRYGNFQALDGLNLEVADGELFGFVGPNGAGKTTTLKILADFSFPMRARWRSADWMFTQTEKNSGGGSAMCRISSEYMIT